MTVVIDASTMFESREMRLKTGEKILGEDRRIRIGSGRRRRRVLIHRRTLMIDQTSVDIFENQIDEFTHGDVVQEGIFGLKD